MAWRIVDQMQYKVIIVMPPGQGTSVVTEGGIKHRFDPEIKKVFTGFATTEETFDNWYKEVEVLCEGWLKEHNDIVGNDHAGMTGRAHWIGCSLGAIHVAYWAVKVCLTSSCTFVRCIYNPPPLLFPAAPRLDEDGLDQRIRFRKEPLEVICKCSKKRAVEVCRRRNYRGLPRSRPE